MLNNIFYKILDLSLTSSFIIICIIFLRFILKKVPKIYSFALWSVVFFRLICPYSFETSFSFLPKTEVSSSYSNLNSVQLETTTSSPIDTYNLENHKPFPLTFTNNTSIYAIIWIIGVYFLVAYSLISFIKLKKKLAVSLNLEKNIYVVDFLTTPFVLGLINPKIYLPSNLTYTEQNFIITHENYHIKRLDHITKFLAFTILCLHWFNPLVWLAFILFEKDMELSIDEKVIADFSNKTDYIKNYATTLLYLGTKNKLNSPLFITPSFKNGDIKERISNIMNFKKTSILLGSILTFLVIFAVIFFSTSKLNKEYDIEFAEFLVDSYVEFTYLDIYSDELKQAQLDNKIAHYANPNNFFSSIYLAHGLLPKNQQLESKLLDLETLTEDFQSLNLSSEVLELSEKLFTLYSSSISYDITNSEQIKTELVSSDKFSHYIVDNNSKDIEVTYGKVSLNIKPLDISQGISDEFDLIWEKFAEDYSDLDEIRNEYLIFILNLLIEKYKEPVYKDEVNYDVYISYHNAFKTEDYSFSLSENSISPDPLTDLQIALFDFYDRY